MKNHVEVLIFGAGVAGSTLSRLVAKKGYDVLLADPLAKDRIGKKVCGNAVPEKYFEFTDTLKPVEGEFESRVEGLKIHSPDLETVFTIPDRGYVLDRQKFGQRLLDESLDAGASLVDHTLAVSPLVNGNRVVGATVKDLEQGRSSSLFGRITVDATGFASRLRRMLPRQWWVAEQVGREESYSIYREIRVLKEEIDDPEYCHIFLSRKVAPLGYCWVFPQGPMRVNIGVGIYTGLRGNPREIFDLHIAGLTELEGSEVVDRGIGMVPNRRPIGSMVWNGFACIGDAAYQVNPLAGEGIGPSMHSARMLSDVISSAELKEHTVDSLWPFNIRYMKLYGARFSALNVFFWLMSNFSDEEISYLMASGLISENDLRSTVDKAKVSWTRKMDGWFLLRAILGRFSLLKKVKSLGDLVREVFDLYSSYPSDPEGYEDWKGLDQAFFRKLRSLHHLPK